MTGLINRAVNGIEKFLTNTYESLHFERTLITFNGNRLETDLSNGQITSLFATRLEAQRRPNRLAVAPAQMFEEIRLSNRLEAFDGPIAYKNNKRIPIEEFEQASQNEIIMELGVGPHEWGVISIGTRRREDLETEWTAYRIHGTYRRIKKYIFPLDQFPSAIAMQVLAVSTLALLSSIALGYYYNRSNSN